MRGSVVRPSISGPRITAAARVVASFVLQRGPETKVIWPAPARSREPTWLIRVCGSPATRPPSREAISPSVSGPGMSLRGRLAFQRLDHLGGVVDARGRGGGVLGDDVVRVRRGDRAGGARGLLPRPA